MSSQACAECTQNCLLIHGKNKDPSPVVTSFFKVMIGEDFSKVLFLPPQFAPTVLDLIDRKTQLEDVCGQKWTVTLSKYKGSLAFRKGWNDFSLEHGLKVGDFLVFHYIMGSHFVVQIYGKSGCQKLDFLEEYGNRKKRMRTNGNSRAKDGQFHRINGDLIDNDGLSNSAERRTNMDNEGLSNSAEMRTNMDNERLSNSAEIRTNRNSGAKDGQCHKINGDLMNKDGTSTSAVSGSNVEISQSQPVATDDNSNLDTGNGSLVPRTAYIEEPFYIIGKDVEDRQRDLWSSLCDLSKFEMQTSGVDGNAKVLAEEERPLCQASTMPRSKTEPILEKNNEIPKMNDVTAVSEKNSGNTGGQKQRSTTHSSTGQALTSQKDTLTSRTRGAHQKFARTSEFSGLPFAFQMQNCQSREKMKVVKRELVEMKQGVSGRREMVHGKSPEINKCDQSSNPAIKDSDHVCKVVKTEPVDTVEFGSTVAVKISFLVVADKSSFLELPTGLPFSSSKRKAKMDRKVVVLLRDPVCRLWPVLYNENCGIKALTSGWKAFGKANKIQPGDECAFEVENEFECIFKVGIVRK